jgi:hypothetical protein
MKDGLEISQRTFDEVNHFLTKENNPAIDGVIELVDRYGGAKRINDIAEENGRLQALVERL